MSRAISDESRKILLAGIFLGAAERIGRKPVSEMEPKAESSGHGGEEGKEESRGDTVQKKEPRRSRPGPENLSIPSPYYNKKEQKIMRKTHKKQAEDFIKLLEQAHIEIKNHIESKNYPIAMDLLSQCQEGAIGLGNLIEHDEGEGFVTVPLLESYCEQVYHIYEDLHQNQDINPGRAYKNLKKSLIQIENSVKQDIKVRLEVVFLPYKASMWDSLESVWLAADGDPDCDAYVVPIPYFERNPDGSLGTRHYEGADFPDYVPVTNCEEYRLAERRPDVIYIHNPYDQGNYVTSVDPRFYSAVLKSYTDCLVYIPYYSTAGGMSEGQALCPAYFNVDYIVVQCEKIIDFFDPRVPREKFLALGSPKFDRVIRRCQNPPEPPAEWKEKMKGRKVYFYNTSIGGMLGDTKIFLKKMEYVFKCFEGREDACLLWRPHPLLESTFESMRGAYYGRFKELKEYFIENDLGIYDDTPDMTDTVALSDVYLGDSGTSVTSLFGIAGKPMFIMDNSFYSEPEPDDWRGQYIGGFRWDGQNRWKITQGNKLYYSPNNDYRYKYACDLSEYSGGGYYCTVLEINGTAYACPGNAQDILVIKNHKVVRRIVLEHCLEQAGAFAGAWNVGNYLFLIPRSYPAIVRYDTEQDSVDYITGYNDGFVVYVEGEQRVGGTGVWENYLMLASPVDNHIIAIESETKKVQVMTTGAQNSCGCAGMLADGEDLWLLPYVGTTLTRWNPKTGQMQEYSDIPEGFICRKRPYGYECLERPFNMAVFYKDQIYISPGWGNMFLRLDKNMGTIEKWTPPFPVLEEPENGYYSSSSPGHFLHETDTLGEGTFQYFSIPNAVLYDVNLETGEYREVPVEIDLEDLREQEPGFCEVSQWLQYGCGGSYFNSLGRFLDGIVVGNPFDRERQLRAYEKIAANNDGTCGEKIYQTICLGK